jgi:hypothetical protein
MGNCFVIPYILDEPPSGGARYKTLTQDNLVKYDLFKYYVLWDPMFSNSNFTQKSLNLDDFLKDKKYKILDSLSSREGKSYLLVKQKEF